MTYRLRAEGLAWQQVEDEIVCLDLSTSKYLSVNPTGAAIWPLLVEGADSDALEEQLVTVFGIDRELAARDAAAFVDELVSRGLVEQL